MKKEYLDILCCPVCKSNLREHGESLKCSNKKCKKTYPISNGNPVLINESNSLFSISSILKQSDNQVDSKSAFKRLLSRCTPGISLNLISENNYDVFLEMILKKNRRPKVLVLGGRILGSGMEKLVETKSIDLIETDVSFGPRTEFIVDAHDIPFKDESFDAVIIQAVLEHVAYPYRCAEEIFRVLKQNGIVYAETPFMQQVHGGRYDFTRFTHLGHNMLFGRFEEISSGPVLGPAAALSWSIVYFFSSFFRTKKSRALVNIMTRLSIFWIKYLDYYLINKPGSYNMSSSYYFLGRKSHKKLVTIISSRGSEEQNRFIY